MSDLRQAATLALEALKSAAIFVDSFRGQKATQEAISALEDALEQQQAEPVQKPPYQGWWPGCQVCGAHGATGFVCPRLDCPTKVTCGGVV